MKSIEKLINKESYENIISRETEKFKNKLKLKFSLETLYDFQNMFSSDMKSMLFDYMYNEIFGIEPFTYDNFRNRIYNELNTR